MNKSDLVEMGCICAICWRPLAEEYDRPLACEECGGEAVLGEDNSVVEQAKRDHGQLGVGS